MPKLHNRFGFIVSSSSTTTGSSSAHLGSDESLPPQGIKLAPSMQNRIFEHRLTSRKHIVANIDTGVESKHTCMKEHIDRDTDIDVQTNHKSNKKAININSDTDSDLETDQMCASFSSSNEIPFCYDDSQSRTRFQSSDSDTIDGSCIKITNAIDRTSLHSKESIPEDRIQTNSPCFKDSSIDLTQLTENVTNRQFYNCEKNQNDKPGANLDKTFLLGSPNIADQERHMHEQYCRLEQPSAVSHEDVYPMCLSKQSMCARQTPQTYTNETVVIHMPGSPQMKCTIPRKTLK